MKIKVSMAVLSVFLPFATMPTPVFAGTQKPANMTCEEFLALDDVVKPKVVYWAEGYNTKGEAIDAVVDVDQTEKLIPVLVAECKETPKASLSKTIEKHSAAPSAPAATQKPANMTCEEFVALDDVVKPKVVYWAQGFNKKGWPTDSEVDVGETDRLVPVLVAECKETPKLTLWQRLKKHF